MFPCLLAEIQYSFKNIKFYVMKVLVVVCIIIILGVFVIFNVAK